MKYDLVFIGVYSQATPREMMLQNIQKMLYIKADNRDLKLNDLKEELMAMSSGDAEQIEAQNLAVTDWINFQIESNPSIDMETVVVPADGLHYVQFDIRPSK